MKSKVSYEIRIEYPVTVNSRIIIASTFFHDVAIRAIMRI